MAKIPLTGQGTTLDNEYKKFRRDETTDERFVAVTDPGVEVKLDEVIDALENINFDGTVTVSNEVEVKNDVGNPIPTSDADTHTKLDEINDNLTNVQDSIDTFAAQNNADLGVISDELSDANVSLTSIDSKLTAPLIVSALDLDIRDLDFASDSVDVSGSIVALDAPTLAALEDITVTISGGAVEITNDLGNPIPVSATDLDIRNLNHTQDQVKIGDGTDTLLVTTAGEAHSKVNAAPLNDLIYKIVNLRLDGTGVKTLNVNGAVTPQIFSFVPAASETWFIESVSLAIGDGASPDFNEFGSLGAALTNGLVLEVQSKGVLYEITNIQDNLDISLSFIKCFYPSSGTGWLNDQDNYMGELTFQKPMLIQNSSADFIRFRVRDNLININWLQARVKAWRMP